MNNRNEAKTSQELNTASNEESLSQEATFNSDVEFSSNFAVNLLKKRLYVEQEANSCYVLGYN
ncbi:MULTISPECIES: hypothetical protein [Colwellia]|jgi:hypothetical protein|uniref:Uncharacterized protein n=1 Tax=Colwellia psychrerythraea (strain 34H / ATCC BAA-681) TaxID=167879 RepID=Q489X1_COLP3|nr:MULTISPECIES: hypothetical protein [Colwellia]AAZ28158.1 hypothetical protein CPS_0385 [Colwellia psychrerythraea 34H]PKH88995.1 hypothetical protein CXF79_03685 [Colwellia sp. Bg11-28]